MKFLFGCLSCFVVVCGFSQSDFKYLTIDEAVKMAVLNHPVSQNAELQVQANLAQSRSVAIPQTEITYRYGQFHSSLYDKSFEVKQNFGSPVQQIARRKTDEQKLKVAQSQQKVTLKQLICDVKSAYFMQVYQTCRVAEFKQIKQKLAFIEDTLRRMNDRGEAALFELTVLETHYAELQNEAFEAEQDLRIAQNQFQQAVYTDLLIVPSDTILELYAIIAQNKGFNKFQPGEQLTYYQKLADVEKAELSEQKAGFFPDIFASYYNQELNHRSGFQGFSLGVSVPLWFVSQKQQVAKTALQKRMADNEVDYQRFFFKKTIDNLKIQLDQYFVSIGYYRENALRQADLIDRTADVNFQQKKMGTLEYFDAIRTAAKIRINYLEKLKLYNITAAEIEKLIN